MRDPWTVPSVFSAVALTLAMLTTHARMTRATADGDRDRCLAERYVQDTHLSNPKVREHLDALTPELRQAVLETIIDTVQRCSLDTVRRYDQQRRMTPACP
jgi:hypothetical protein